MSKASWDLAFQWTKIRITLFFPDVNTWIALVVSGHPNNKHAWGWLQACSPTDRLALCSTTQLGMLRLLTNAAAMGDAILTLGEAWSVYDHWLADQRVVFLSDPAGANAEFRRFTKPFANAPATKSVGDCWLLAMAQSADARLVTFDKALHQFASKQGNHAVQPNLIPPLGLPIVAADNS